MKQSTTKIIEYCDVCKREAGSVGLEKCIICGREFCWSCRPSLYNIYSITVDTECFNKPPYKKMFERELENWRSHREVIKNRIAKYGKILKSGAIVKK